VISINLFPTEIVYRDITMDADMIEIFEGAVNNE
jgi:hypothetical protein